MLDANNVAAVQATCDGIDATQAADLIKLAGLVCDSMCAVPKVSQLTHSATLHLLQLKHDFGADINTQLHNNGSLAELAQQARSYVLGAQARAFWAPRVATAAASVSMEQVCQMAAQATQAAQASQTTEPAPAAATLPTSTSTASSITGATSTTADLSGEEFQPREVTEEDMWAVEVIKVNKGVGGLGFSFGGGMCVCV